MVDKLFWQNRRVLITGHTGFKGSWLTLWLKSLGAEIVGFSLEPPTQPNLFEQADVASGIRSIFGDIRDLPALKTAMEQFQPEVVLHLAAQSVVRKGYDDPVETYSSNVMGTVNVLEAVRQKLKTCSVVNVTSDKCYENNEWIWGYRENDRLGGKDPYSNSKACAELVASCYGRSFFSKGSQIKVASARAGNVVGGGDWTADQLIPDLMRAFLNERSCLIRSPGAIRPWQFVLEPLHGYLLLAEKLAKADLVPLGEGWNFGPPTTDTRPVAWIADELKKRWGGNASWITDTGSHHAEARLLTLDAAKAQNELNWQSVLPLSEALAWIVSWYRDFESKADLGKRTRDQIAQYENILI